MGKVKILIPLSAIFIVYLLIFTVGNNSICFFKGVFGIPCPGCGMTRAFIHIIKGDLYKAFYYNPFFIVPILIVVVLLFKNKIAFINTIYKSNFILLSLVIITYIGWIIRMFVMFPHNEPLDYNSSALFPKLFRDIFMYF